MSTIRIYQTDRYMTENKAEITAVREINGFDTFTCTQSVFFPVGGGQPSDTGTVSLGDKVYEVVSASDNGLESDVWHLTDAPSGTFQIPQYAAPSRRAYAQRDHAHIVRRSQ